MRWLLGHIPCGVVQGAGGERGGGSLPGSAAAPLLLPESRGGAEKVKGGWSFSFSFASLLFPLTVPGSSFMVP